MPQFFSVHLIMILGIFFSKLSSADEVIKTHSLHRPFLEDYWDSGLQYWSFGSSTVLTDDIVRLTTREPSSHGYLWNLHPNGLDSFFFNVTLTFSKQKGSWTEDLSHAGFGVWYTSDTPRHASPNFFGSTNQFSGLGVLIDHDGEVSVLVSDGYHPVKNYEAERKGHCRIPLSNSVTTISVQYCRPSQMLRVRFFQRGFSFRDHKESGEVSQTECATVAGVDLNSHHYFGVTGANDANVQSIHEVGGFYVKPHTCSGGESRGSEYP